MSCNCCCCEKERREFLADYSFRHYEVLRPQAGKYCLAKTMLAWWPIRCPEKKQWFWLKRVAIYEISRIKSIPLVCDWYIKWERSHVNPVMRIRRAWNEQHYQMSDRTAAIEAGKIASKGHAL